MLTDNFGEQVKTKYVDVIDDNMDDYPEIDEYLVKAGTGVLPLVVVNGKIVNPGTGINYRDILEVLQDMGVGGDNND